MKKIYTLLIIFLVQFNGISQIDYLYGINFEDISQLHRLTIDTISNPNNIWDIASPNKTNLSSAYSLPNVIITDSISSYPVNDTSSFVIEHLAGQGYYFNQSVLITGKYWVNSDTLSDFGAIEFSPDLGNTWVNLITDTVYANMHCYSWWSQKPVLSGNSSGWVDFTVLLDRFSLAFNIQTGDTMLYRFTFVSDSIETYKDGLMFDDLYFDDSAEGIEGLEGTFNTKAFPNPCINIVNLEFENLYGTDNKLFIYGMNGILIEKRKISNTSITKIDLKTYQTGIYHYILFDTNNKKHAIGSFQKIK